METTKNNLLILTGGKWVGMVLQMRRAMQQVSSLEGGKLIVADIDAMAPAGRFADLLLKVPRIGDSQYVASLLGLCDEYDVRVVVPLIDLDVSALAPHRERFKAIGTSLIVPEANIVDMCFDKARFLRFAEEEGFPFPQVYSWDEVETLPADAFPLFRRVRRGFGSIGSGLCYSVDEARRAREQWPDLIFQEPVSAPELTVDGFISDKSQPTVRVPRLREKVLGGEAVKTTTVGETPAGVLADKVIRALCHAGLRGPFNVQIFDGDAPMLIEVNTRLGSASVLSNMATGGRYFASVLNEACGSPVVGDPDDYRVGMSMSRFFGDCFYSESGVEAVFPGSMSS